jgi:hypothetical protein
MRDEQIKPRLGAMPPGMIRRMFAPYGGGMSFRSHGLVGHVAGALRLRQEFGRLRFHDEIRFVVVVPGVVNLEVALGRLEPLENSRVVFQEMKRGRS